MTFCNELNSPVVTVFDHKVHFGHWITEYQITVLIITFVNSVGHRVRCVAVFVPRGVLFDCLTSHAGEAGVLLHWRVDLGGYFANFASWLPLFCIKLLPCYVSLLVAFEAGRRLVFLSSGGGDRQRR